MKGRKTMTMKGRIRRGLFSSLVLLALGIGLSASADAGTVHSSHTRHVLIRPDVASSFAAVRGWAYAPPQPPVQYDAAPSYDDPSKFGGGTALPVQ